jgi:hypothetical protein
MASLRRHRGLISGIIEFERHAYSCFIRNLSESGAALDVSYTLDIPDEFDLVMETDQLRRQCRVVWRKENRLGVTFAAGTASP